MITKWAWLQKQIRFRPPPVKIVIIISVMMNVARMRKVLGQV